MAKSVTEVHENKDWHMDSTHGSDTHAEAHHWPHIPTIQWETVYGPISNTVVATFVFFILITIVSFFANKALKSDKKSKLKLFFLTFIKFFDGFLRDGFWSKKTAREFFPLIAGFFIIILFGNLLGLIIDWLGSSVSESIFYVLRPMHSDVNTTLVLSLITLITLLYVQIRTLGAGKTAKHYFFNFSGSNFTEKAINVPVGWLHFIGLPATTISLSLRLFGNIFAGVVLIGVITYLLATATAGLYEVGRLFVLPFWFFEVFVSLVQAIVFAGLMMAYFKQSGEEHH